MQVVTEGLALYVFRDMRNQTQEPLLKRMLTYVSRDEARHTGYGIKYLSAVVPTLSDEEKAGARGLRVRVGSSADRLAFGRLAATEYAHHLVSGIDLGSLEERSRIGRSTPADTSAGLVIPTLRSIGR